jgi:hypothetical protein
MEIHQQEAPSIPPRTISMTTITPSINGSLQRPQPPPRRQSTGIQTPIIPPRTLHSSPHASPRLISSSDTTQHQSSTRFPFNTQRQPPELPPPPSKFSHISVERHRHTQWNVPIPPPREEWRLHDQPNPPNLITSMSNGSNTVHPVNLHYDVLRTRPFENAFGHKTLNSENSTALVSALRHSRRKARRAKSTSVFYDQ